MPKLDRLLYLLQLIKVRRNLDAKRLAKECGVSERTIFRDINSLAKDANINIFYDRGFKLVDETFLPPLNFNLDELLTLWVGFQSAPVRSNTFFVKTAKSILIKIETQLPEKTKRDFRNIREVVKVMSKEEGSLREALYFKILRLALTESRNIDLVYKEGSLSQSYSQVQPKELVWKQKRWNLNTLCRSTNKVFELEKIITVTLSGA